MVGLGEMCGSLLAVFWYWSHLPERLQVPCFPFNPLPLSHPLPHPSLPRSFSKAAVTPLQAVQPACKIAPFADFQGIKIPTPCLFPGLWP